MQNSRILIVEDEIIIALNIENILKKLGYTVIGIVSSGKDCLEAVSRNRPDLILMDIILEGDMDGIELAGIIRDSEDIPVIFLTAYSDRTSVQKAKQKGPYGYIVKPVNEKDLLSTIETAISRSEIDKQLKENEEKYRALFEQSWDAIYLRRPDGIITVANQALFKLFGYSSEEVIGAQIQDFIPPEMNEVIDTNLREKGFIRDLEMTLKNSNGNAIECLVNVNSLCDSKGRVFALQGIIRDITESIKARKERDNLLLAISKRVNELNCLYSISEFAENPDFNLHDILENMTRVIPQSWQYPDITVVRIMLQGHECQSLNFRLTQWIQRSDIYVYGNKAGSIEVCLLEERPALIEGPFSREERDLLNALAERLSRLAERDEALHQLQESNSSLSRLSSHLQTVREEERTRIAREIHDELGQALTAIKMDVSWIKRKVPEDYTGVTSRIEAILGLVDKTIGSVRKISSELRPGILDDLGLVPAIEWQADEIMERTGINCHVICDRDDIDLGDSNNVALFRIVQEALTNVVRHAEATRVEINLSQMDDRIELEIQDNGRGIEESELKNPQSFGLIGMHERVHFCNGSLEITGEKGRGTHIRVTIPLAMN